MERLQLKYQDLEKTLRILKEVLDEPPTVFMRDSAIKRFELTFEVLWKFLKEYLAVKEGIHIASPKAVFRELTSLGYLSESDTEKFLLMTDRRNESVHVYKEDISKKIYEDLKGYMTLMDMLTHKIRDLC